MYCSHKQDELSLSFVHYYELFVAKKCSVCTRVDAYSGFQDTECQMSIQSNIYKSFKYSPIFSETNIHVVEKKAGVPVENQRRRWQNMQSPQRKQMFSFAIQTHEIDCDLI